MYNNPNQPPQPPYGQPPFQGQQPPYGQPPFQGQQPPYGQPPYAADGIPPIYATPAPQKKSRKKLWIVLGIIAGILVLGCGAIGVTVFKVGSQVAAPVIALSSYYEALKTQNYTQAYTYLDPQSLTVQGQTVTSNIYALAEASVDKQFGPVTDYKLSTTQIQNDTATITVNETRNQPRTITYILKRIGNEWKISGINNGEGLPTTGG
jgi:hypothetical protein